MEEASVKFTGFLDRMIEDNDFSQSTLDWMIEAIGDLLGKETQHKAEELIRKKNWKEFRKILVDFDDEIEEKKKPTEKPKPVVEEEPKEITRPTQMFKEVLEKMFRMNRLLSQIAEAKQILDRAELTREYRNANLKKQKELEDEFDALSSSVDSSLFTLTGMISKNLGVDIGKEATKLAEQQNQGWSTAFNRMLRKVERIMYVGEADKFLVVLAPYKKRLDEVERGLGKGERTRAEGIIYDIQIHGKSGEIESKRDELQKIFKLAKVSNAIGRGKLNVYLKAVKEKDEDEVRFIERLASEIKPGRRFSVSELEFVRMSVGDEYANALSMLTSAYEREAPALEIARLRKAVVDLGLASMEIKREIRAKRLEKVEPKTVEKKKVKKRANKIKRRMVGTSKRAEERKSKALRRYRTVSPIRKDISELVEKWLDRMQRDVAESGKNRAKTIKTYRYGINTFSRWLEERDYKTLRHSDATLYVDWLQDAPRKYKSRTIQVKLSAVSKFFEYMLARDLVPINPFSVARAPKAGELKPRPLSADDDRELITYLDSVIEDALIRLKPSGVTETGVKWRIKAKRIKREAQSSMLRRDACIALLLMRFAGMRVSEVFDLESRWVKKATKIGDDRGFEYRRIITIRHGKGSKERTTILVPYFTPKRDQINKFQEYIINFFDEKQKTGGRLFLRDQSWLRRFLKRIKAEGRIAKGITFHRLRHTYAQTLLDSGASIELVAELLGHADTKTTRGYARITSRALEEKFVTETK